MKNVFGVVVKKYRKNQAFKSSILLLEKVLTQNIDEFFSERFVTKEDFNRYLVANYLASAFQDGLSAGIKLSTKHGKNDAEAITFVIKELQKLKDSLKVSIANEVTDNS